MSCIVWMRISLFRMWFWSFAWCAEQLDTLHHPCWVWHLQLSVFSGCWHSNIILNVMNQPLKWWNLICKKFKKLQAAQLTLQFSFMKDCPGNSHLLSTVRQLIWEIKVHSWHFPIYLQTQCTWEGTHGFPSVSWWTAFLTNWSTPPHSEAWRRVMYLPLQVCGCLEDNCHWVRR